jgi:hypothetical protein
MTERMRWAGAAAPRLVVACAMALVGLMMAALPAAATDAFPTTNDQATTIAVARWWYTGVTGSQIGALLNQNGARITELRVEDPSVPTFTVTMVQNTGAYGSGWWWYYGVDGPTVSNLLAQNNARLISIDPYQTGGGLRFAVVMVPNTGAQGRAWWWYYGVSSATVGSLLSTNNARPVALRPYLSGGQLVYAVIMVSNTGVDYKPYEWWIGASISFIAGHVNSDAMRVITLAPDPLGGWDAVLVGSEGEAWWWWFGISAATVTNNLINDNSRLIDVSSYVSGRTRVYATVELDDSNATESPINAASAAVAAYAENNGWAGGLHGEYFIPSAPGSAPIVAENPDFRFEPASSIKALYLLYTLQQGVSLSDPITYYWTDNNPPTPTVCPSTIPETPANAHTTTIGNALTQMIQASNNVYTRAFALRWGLGPVQAMASSLGMSSTHLNQQFIGCGFQGGVRNELTLADAARLYAAVDNGTALAEPARSTFFSILVGGTPSATDPWGTVVSQEAAAQGKSAIVPQFLAAMNVRWKAGSYGFCAAPCPPGSKVDYSIAGWISIPFSDGSFNQSYEFGDFVNDLIIPCNNNCAAQTNAGNAIFGVAAETARSTIAAALATW